MHHSGTESKIQEHVLGMGVDIKGLHWVINYGPQITWKGGQERMARIQKHCSCYMDTSFTSVSQRC